MKAILKSSRSMVLLILFMFLLPIVAFAADTIRVNIPRVTVTRAGNHSFTSGANSVYVPVEFTFAMSADRVADYVEESNAVFHDHFGDGVVERNDYYPLGMRTDMGNGYRQLAANLYRYNGKEVQTTGGLGFTDYGARMYDDFTGRWFVPDPLAKKYLPFSPYMYCGGDPIAMIDVDGRDWYKGKGTDGKIGVEWKNSRDDTISDADGNIWKNIGENYVDERLGIITLYTQTEGTDGNLYKHSSEYYFNDESSMDDFYATVADLMSKGSAIAGGIDFLAKNSNATFRLTNGNGLWSPKFYKNGWRGNQWVKTVNVGRIGKYLASGGTLMGIRSVIISGYQYYNAQSFDEKIVYGSDVLIGTMGLINGAGAAVSLYWSFGGKELHYMYVNRVIIPQVQMGINPGYMIYQPFK